MPLESFFLLFSTWSASSFKVNFTEMGLPLVGLYFPSLSVETICNSLAFFNFSSYVSPCNVLANSRFSFCHLGSGSSHFSSLIPVITMLVSSILSSMLVSHCLRSMFSFSILFNRPSTLSWIFSIVSTHSGMFFVSIFLSKTSSLALIQS